MSMGIENSRRFRAFSMWLHHSEKYQLLEPCELDAVLFTPSRDVVGMASDKYRVKLNASSQLLLTRGAWQGKPIMRAALSNWATTVEGVAQVIYAFDAITYNWRFIASIL